MKIGLGGGCHWCTEAVFAALRGVEQVEQGYIRADAPHDNWSEAVQLHVDLAVIPLVALIEVHLRTHASTSAHKMRGKYRSAIYVENDADAASARDILEHLAKGFEAPLVTQVLPLRSFDPSPERYRNYAQKNAGGPFCNTYIDPKLALLRRQFAAHLHSE